MCNGNAPSDSWREAWDPSYLRSASVSSKTLPNARGRVPCTARKLCSRVGVSSLVKARPQKIKVKQWLDHQFEIGERDKTKKAKPEELSDGLKGVQSGDMVTITTEKKDDKAAEKKDEKPEEKKNASSPFSV